MPRKVLIINPGFAKNDHVPLDLLQEHGCEVLQNDSGRSLTRGEIMKSIGDAEAVVVGVERLDADILSHAPKLKVISKYGVGLDNIDVEYARENGIEVARTAGANADAVADTAFGLILAVSKKIAFNDAACRRGEWLEPDTYEVNHKTLGIIGLGDIGRKVTKRSTGFDMRVLAYDLFEDAAYAKKHHIEYVDLPALLSRADIISIHVPILPETRNLIGEKEIGMMKPTAILINTARGGIVDEEALISALKAGHIFGAGLDVFEKEPIDHERWMDIPNVVLSSHCAADTNEAINRMSQMAAENIIKHLA